MIPFRFVMIRKTLSLSRTLSLSHWLLQSGDDVALQSVERELLSSTDENTTRLHSFFFNVANHWKVVRFISLGLIQNTSPLSLSLSLSRCLRGVLKQCLLLRLLLLLSKKCEKSKKGRANTKKKQKKNGTRYHVRNHWACENLVVCFDRYLVSNRSSSAGFFGSPGVRIMEGAAHDDVRGKRTVCGEAH